MTVINSEPGVDKLTPQIPSTALTSTVNLAEVHGKLIHVGFSPDDAWAAANGTIQEAIVFTAEHAKVAADLVIQARPLGLSFGDRACLALAIALQAAVYTADRSWKNLDVGVRIHVIR